MSATVYFIEPTPEQAREIRRLGRSSEVSLRLQNAKSGDIHAGNVDMVVLAATVELDDLEQIYCKLQNDNQSWTKKLGVVCHTVHARSMQEGDLVELNGELWRCNKVAFSRIRLHVDLPTKARIPGYRHVADVIAEQKGKVSGRWSGGPGDLQQMPRARLRKLLARGRRI